MSDLEDYIRRTWPSDLSDDVRSAVVAMYRAVALGKPVSDLPNCWDTVTAAHPDDWAEVDGNGNVVAIGGLSQVEGPHRLMVEGIDLYAWCAFDCLFLPEVLGKPVEVRSTCPATGDPIEILLGVDPDVDAFSEGFCLTFSTPAVTKRTGDLRGSFCNQIHFFTSIEAARDWASGKPDLHVLTLDQGRKLAGFRNSVLFGNTLNRA